MPAMNDNSLLDDDLPFAEDTPAKEHRALMNKVSELIQSGKHKAVSSSGSNCEDQILQDSTLHDDELAILAGYGNEAEAGVGVAKQDAKDIIMEYDEYEKQLI